MNIYIVLRNNHYYHVCYVYSYICVLHTLATMKHKNTGGAAYYMIAHPQPLGANLLLGT
jgi:nitrate reductase alpha subunit